MVRLKKISEMATADYWGYDQKRSKIDRKLTYYPLPAKNSTSLHCRVTELIDDVGLTFSAITMKDLLYAKQKVPASNSPAEVNKYDQFYKALQLNMDTSKMACFKKK